MAEEIPTVKIVSSETEQGFMIINQTSFDPAAMQLWYEPGTEPAAEPAVDVTPSGDQSPAPASVPVMTPPEVADPMTPSEPSGDVIEPGRRRRGV
jgi:hypothetical protein